MMVDTLLYIVGGALLNRFLNFPSYALHWSFLGFHSIHVPSACLQVNHSSSQDLVGPQRGITFVYSYEHKYTICFKNNQPYLMYNAKIYD